uniref:C2H2-type domain-containing protein n=1 Tax=Zonotrichia albicollis TaxID=44394 RepID=A0A8D2MMM4_ZONAL
MSELQEHRRAHLLENSYRCPICAKGFSRAANLRMHKLIHSSERPHKCPECDKGFIRTADVWRHLRNVHKIERSMVILASGMARNPWSVVHHGQQHNAECPDQACPANPKSQEDDFKPYACPTCGKGFDKPNLLSKHKVIHREDKPYKCQECGMAFVQLLRLKRHQQTHSGARPFYCEECGGTFTRLASLQRHHRIHTGEKPYSCNFCGHSFTESGTLRRHEQVCSAGLEKHPTMCALRSPDPLPSIAASQGALELHCTAGTKQSIICQLTPAKGTDISGGGSFYFK